jgi:threonine/homoserine/homoserine lactone efflux protein
MLSKIPWKATLGLMSAPILWAILSITVWKMLPSWKEFAFTFVIGICGAALGWLVGLLASPYTKDEESRFTAMSKAISVFFSGYAVAKLEPIVGWLTSPDRLASNHLLVARILVFVAVFSTAIIQMYVYRIYIDPNEAGVREPGVVQNRGTKEIV